MLVCHLLPDGSYTTDKSALAGFQQQVPAKCDHKVAAFDKENVTSGHTWLLHSVKGRRSPCHMLQTDSHVFAGASC